MNARSWMMVGLVACTSSVWAAGPKENLAKSRSEYQHAVAQHGAHSAEARSAKQHLRAARRTYHNDRRQHQQRQSSNHHGM